MLALGPLLRLRGPQFQFENEVLVIKSTVAPNIEDGGIKHEQSVLAMETFSTGAVRSRWQLNVA